MSEPSVTPSQNPTLGLKVGPKGPPIARTDGRTNGLRWVVALVEKPLRPYREPTPPDPDSNLEQPTRHPVWRTGERPEIPQHVRFAVYSRDANLCCVCRIWLGQSLRNLDHIVPWSALGADDSTNLRTLCPPCNEARSNYVDHAQPMKPCTWWCTDCWVEGHERRAHWTNKIWYPGWRENRPYLDPTRPLVLAHCAFCGIDGYTDATWVI